MKTEIEKFYPKVSIVIPAYNASNYLAEAIDSALAQTYKNIEIIVVNDGSKDDGATSAVVKRYRGRVHYIEKENGGSSSALNTGIQHMTGEWFSWLSHDDLYAPQKIEKQIEYLRDLRSSHSDITHHVCFSAADLIDGNGAVIKKSDYKKASERSKKIRGFSDNAPLVAEPTKYNFNGCSCLIHKSVFQEVGLFDENLRLLNDIDMWFRIYTAGYHVHFLPDSLVKGRVHAKQISRSIGFSYHNPEQDWFWARSYEWLEKNVPERIDLFFAYGKNAFLKTRNVDGEKAFKYVGMHNSKIKLLLCMEKNIYKLCAAVKTFGKNIYLKLRA